MTSVNIMPRLISTVTLSSNQTLENKLSIFNSDKESEGWHVNVDSCHEPFPAFRKGIEILERGGNLLVAICLNNGHYNRSNIHKLLNFISTFSGKVFVFFTDGPAVHNYVAYGRPLDWAFRESRKQHNRLKNACISSINQINSLKKSDFSVEFVEWEGICSNRAYQTQFAYFRSLYDSRGRFHDDLSAETQKYLVKSGKCSDPAVVINVGVKYIIEELAFLCMFQEFISAGSLAPVQNDFTYIYHLR